MLGCHSYGQHLQEKMPGMEMRRKPLRVMNGPLKFFTARKILPLLDLFAKFKRVLACSCFLVSIARNFVNPSLG